MKYELQSQKQKSFYGKAEVLKMKIEDWNECLKYAKSKCNEYENLKMVTYEMWDGRKGIKFFTLDCFGNPYNTYNTGTKKNKREMKNAIDISIEKLMQ